jgi:hypothetical protein
MVRETEMTKLRQKLAAREGRPGFKANVAEIKKRIAALEAEKDDA